MIRDKDDARAYCSARVATPAFAKLESLSSLLASENDRQNLVARSSLQAVWHRHFADSLQLADHVPRGTGEWLDLGSGGGFPGLVIAIAQPERPVVLIESRKLRVAWLERAAEALALRNVVIFGKRLEDVSGRLVAAISARAFAPLPRLLELYTRFSTPETVWVLPKGRSARQELEEQPDQVRAMFHVEQSLTDAEAGILVGRGVPKLQ